MIPFRLKNAGATFQRLVNKVFADQISRNVEAYINDIVIKSQKAKDHTKNLHEVFGVLRKYKVKFNPEKCVFRVSAEKFLKYMVSQRGIEANPKKI